MGCALVHSAGCWQVWARQVAECRCVRTCVAGKLVACLRDRPLRQCPQAITLITSVPPLRRMETLLAERQRSNADCMVKCLHCGKMFTSQTGYATHASKSQACRRADRGAKLVSNPSILQEQEECQKANVASCASVLPTMQVSCALLTYLHIPFCRCR